jgi:hypothetical protein
MVSVPTTRFSAAPSESALKPRLNGSYDARRATLDRDSGGVIVERAECGNLRGLAIL